MSRLSLDTLRSPNNPLHIALRAYALALSFSLGPSLLTLITTLLRSSKNQSPKRTVTALCRLLKKQLGPHGFAFSMTLATAGGASLSAIWNSLYPLNLSDNDRGPGRVTSNLSLLLDFKRLSPYSTTLRLFICNVIASTASIFLLQTGSRRTAGSSARQPRLSPTIDLTILLAVRALDALIQSCIFKQYPLNPVGISPEPVATHDEISKRLEKEKIHGDTERVRRLRNRIDGVIFWACSARYSTSILCIAFL
jgi:hypothetical protein